MGRKKQLQPRRSARLLPEGHGLDQAELGCQADATVEQTDTNSLDEPLFVEVERSCISDEHLDISELVLTDLHMIEGFSGSRNREDFQGSDVSLRFKVVNVNNFVNRIKLGHWPVLSANDIFLELRDDKDSSLKAGRQTVMLFGRIDGTDEGVSGLVHLIALRFLSLRPVEDDLKLEKFSKLRVRVEIRKSAFDACESLLENTRPLWKKSMINVMAWLHPEVMTSEARYGVCQSLDPQTDLHLNNGDNSRFHLKHHRFDVAGFYEAIKPSK